MNYRTFLGCALLILSVGCLANREYTPVNYYDLGRAEVQKNTLTVEAFRIEGPINERIINRKSNNALELNEYKRWSQPTDLLVTHYLKKCFVPGGDFSVSGSILSLEHDTDLNKINFSIIYIIEKNGRVVKVSNFKRTYPTNGNFDEFINQTSKAAKELATEINQSITSANSG
jgi:ABC-type uncharacterized transport system auxiliary subunit